MRRFRGVVRAVAGADRTWRVGWKSHVTGKVLKFLGVVRAPKRPRAARTT